MTLNIGFLKSDAGSAAEDQDGGEAEGQESPRGGLGGGAEHSGGSIKGEGLGSLGRCPQCSDMAGECAGVAAASQSDGGEIAYV